MVAPNKLGSKTKVSNATKIGLSFKCKFKDQIFVSENNVISHLPINICVYVSSSSIITISVTTVKNN